MVVDPPISVATIDPQPSNCPGLVHQGMTHHLDRFGSCRPGGFGTLDETKFDWRTVIKFLLTTNLTLSMDPVYVI